MRCIGGRWDIASRQLAELAVKKLLLQWGEAELPAGLVNHFRTLSMWFFLQATAHPLDRTF